MLQAEAGGGGEWYEWVWRIVNSTLILALIGFLANYIVPRLRKARENAETAKVQAETTRTEAETAKVMAEAGTTTADEALKIAQAVEQRTETIQKNFERFALQAQKDFDNIRLLRGQVLAAEADIVQLRHEHQELMKRHEETQAWIDWLLSAIPQPWPENLARILEARPNGELKKKGSGSKKEA